MTNIQTRNPGNDMVAKRWEKKRKRRNLAEKTLTKKIKTFYNKNFRTLKKEIED